MAKRHVGLKTNFTNFQHFQEDAVKVLNEIFGRVKPFDVVDFSEDDENYYAVGYYEGEEPAERKAGEKLTPEEEAARDKVDTATDREKWDAAEIAALKERIAAATEEAPAAYADVKRAAEIGFFKDGVEEDAKVYTLAQILGASDQAIATAEEAGIDIRVVKGTGKDGNIKVDDVKAYIKANPAPAQENANGNGINDPANA